MNQRRMSRRQWGWTLAAVVALTGVGWAGTPSPASAILPQSPFNDPLQPQLDIPGKLPALVTAICNQDSIPPSVRPQLAAIVRATVLGESISSIAQSADAVGAAVAGSLLRVGSIRQLRLGVLAIDITDPIVTIRNDTVTINRKGTYVTATDQTGRNLLAADATPAPTPTATPQATQSIAAPPPPPPPRPRAIPTQRPQLPAPTAGAVAGPALAASIHGAVFTSSMGTGKAVMDGSKVRKALKADKSRASKNKRGHGHGASDVSGHWVSAGGRSTLDIRAVGPHHRDMQVTYSLASSLGTYTGSLTTGYAGSWSIGGPLDAQVRFDSDDRLTMTTVLGSETFRRH